MFYFEIFQSIFCYKKEKPYVIGNGEYSLKKLVQNLEIENVYENLDLNYIPKKGEEISHVELWKELYGLLTGHEFTVELGVAHEYRNWMMDEVTKNAKENEDV